MFNLVILIICVIIFIGMIALDIFMIRYKGGNDENGSDKDNEKHDENDDNDNV